MIERLIPRREVLAFIALTTDEASVPHEIDFHEYVTDGGEVRRVVRLYVDSEAAVRFWAKVFGHNKFAYSRHVHTRDNGTRWTAYASHDTGWRGLSTEVRAHVDKPADVPLDDTTTARLREIAEVAS